METVEVGLAGFEPVDDVGVELRTRTAADLLDRLVPADGFAVRPRVGHRIERVDDGEDSRAQRDALGGEPVWVPVAVPPFVVGADDARTLLVEEGNVNEEPLSELCMLLHPPALTRGQGAGLEQDLVGHADLADVVQQEPPFQARVVEQRGRDFEGKPRRVARHPPGVAARPEVSRLERRGEHGHGLCVCLGQELVLAAADLDQPVEVGDVHDAASLVGIGNDPFDHRRDEPQQLERAERLAQECIRSRGARSAAGLLRAADCDDRDSARLWRLAQPLEIEDPVDAREPDVEQDRVGTRLGERALRLDHVVRGGDLEPLQLEGRPDQLTEELVVVDCQYTTCATHFFRTPNRSVTHGWSLGRNRRSGESRRRRKP